MYSIETIDLTHRFSDDEIALDGVDLKVETGSIYGFLGPNGAGKTTTLKLILGLLKKQKGRILIEGEPFEKDRVAILGNIGSLIESPSLYSHLTATENLRVLQKVYGCRRERIDEVLEMVGLAHTGTKKTGQFSLGMKQRLSIAIGMLHEPSLLILDEPTNGLDPNGIQEIRELLIRLNRENGITILVSSHLLSEIERLVTHVGIINRGKLLFQGTLAKLLAKQQQSSYIVFETDDNARTADVIGEHGIAARLDNGGLIIPVIEKQQIAAINRQLTEAGVGVFQITTVKNDLEKIFFDVIGD